MTRSTVPALILFLWIATFSTTECQGVVSGKGNTANVTVVRLRAFPDDEDYDDFVPYEGERFSVFDWNLCRSMGRRYPGNVLVSPISVKLALVLLYEGAQDQTAHELASVMQLPIVRSATRDKFTSILQSLRTTSSSYTLTIGSRLYIDRSVTTRQRYGAIAKAFYGADVVNANLSRTRVVADEVNRWVSDLTNGNIENLIQDDSSIKDSVMLVLNALFFKGTWRHNNAFSPNETRVRKFYTRPNETVDAPFMNTVGRFYLSESSELDAKILRLPYEGHRYSMYMILPNTLTGLDHVIAEVNPFVLTRHVWLMQDLPVEVSIPKFKFEFTSHMESTLRELGIRDIFDNTAILSGIALSRRSSRRLMVSDVVQRAGIEVNEEGTSAYAATEINVGSKVSDQTFHADRPFLFYVEDETTGTVLYVGKVANPLESDGSTELPAQETPSKFNQVAPNVAPVAGKRRKSRGI